MAEESGAGQLSLHPLERRVLSLLVSEGPTSYDELASKIGVNVGAVAKAAEWLLSKGLAERREVETKHIAILGPEGREYAEKGLPERRLVEALREIGGETGLKDLLEKTGLPEHMFNIGVIWAKRRGWISIKREGDDLRFKLQNYPEGETDEELVLKLLRRGPIALEDLGPLRAACERLSRRPGVVNISVTTRYSLAPTPKALQLPSDLLADRDEVSQLTPEMLRTGSWRSRTFRRYDLLSPVKPVFAPRPHPLTLLIDMIRGIFVELGFQEIKGPLVELAFWNFDALFQPQDHPAREMHDTFYLAQPSRGEVPRGLARVVGRVHYNGWKTGSLGWGYRWSVDEASKLVLRTHTTATTIRHLAETRKPPIKVFSVDRVYRNERVDWRRLAEFHQVEGILVDKGANLRQLMGIIREFYARMGLKKVRFRPSYFPYTEPSAEVDVYVDRRQTWVELGGMGVFRPEVTWPLGVREPVLAWGLGLERLAIILLDIQDARMLYQNDLSWLYSHSPIRLEALRWR